jgi:TRAP transporter TAXI family solute receptor
MTRRLTFLAAVLGAIMLMAGGFAASGFGTAQRLPGRLSFVIAAGSTAGTYFPIAQAITEIVSHPPGLARCDAIAACGPIGLEASARTSAGAVANLRDVDQGRVDAGLAQSDVVAEAVAGRGPFAGTGALTHVRLLADLFPEEVHIVARADAHIAHVTDLAGRRVALGAPDSGTAVTARAILRAWRISVSRAKSSDDSPDVAAQRLLRGDIDAFFFVGGAPVPLVQDLLANGRAVLVPLGGPGLTRLLAEEPGLAPDMIAQSTYPGPAAAVPTVRVTAVLIANDAVPEGLVHGVLRALFAPVNRDALDAAHPRARLIRLDTAASLLPAPLHPGAARFYREAGILPAKGG